MKRSSAKSVSYDLRPCKQTERRIILDLLAIAGDCGLAIEDYRYLGMGANRFYDFILIHKQFGIKSMISLEHDPQMLERAKFNNPYKFIQILPQKTGEFLGHDDYSLPTIAWLDYDGGLNTDVLGDINSLGIKMKIGDFAFVTTFAGVPKSVEKMNTSGRKAWFQEVFGDLALALSPEDFETANLHCAIYKLIATAFQNAFSSRRDGKIFIFLKILYSDSTPMVSVGGAFLSDGQRHAFEKRIYAKVPFLHVNSGCYEVRSLNITERERVLFDKAASGKKTKGERRLLQNLGFKDADLGSYKELLRYLPRYVETVI